MNDGYVKRSIQIDVDNVLCCSYHEGLHSAATQALGNC